MPPTLNELLKTMVEQGASDLHLKPTRPPLMRINGRLVPLQADPLTPPQLRQMLDEVLTDQQRAKLEQHMSVDIGYGVHGLARFRGNIYQQRGTVAAAFRLLGDDVPVRLRGFFAAIVSDGVWLQGASDGRSAAGKASGY